jgi:hypothetical protein
MLKAIKNMFKRSDSITDIFATMQEEKIHFDITDKQTQISINSRIQAGFTI